MTPYELGFKLASSQGVGLEQQSAYGITPKAPQASSLASSGKPSDGFKLGPNSSSSSKVGGKPFVVQPEGKK